MDSVGRPLKMRVLCVVAAIVFLFSFHLSTVYAYPGLLYGGAIQLGVQLMYDMFMIGINSAGGTDQIRVNFNNQSLQPTMKDYISYLADGWWSYWTEHSDPEDVIGWDAFLNEFGSDMRYKSDGTVIVGNKTADYIHSFLEWCQDNGYIDVVTQGGFDTPDQITGESFTISSLANSTEFAYAMLDRISAGYTMSATTRAAFNTWLASNNGRLMGVKIPTILYNNGSQNTVEFYCNSTKVAGSSISLPFSTPYNNSWFSFSFTYYTPGNPWNLSNYGTSSSSAIYSSNGTERNNAIYYNNIGAVASVGSAGYDVWNQDDDDEGYVIAPQGALDGLSGVQDGSMANVGDLLDTVADVIAGTDSAALPIAGTAPVAVSLPTDYALPVDVAVPADVVGAVPVEGAATEPYTNTGDYTLSLADFFPFCIPFDIYRMLSVLDASAVAPQFNYPFPIPGGGTYNISIDLSGFNSVAQVLRTMETLGFCVGLAFITKKLLFGS